MNICSSLASLLEHLNCCKSPSSHSYSHSKGSMSFSESEIYPANNLPSSPPQNSVQKSLQFSRIDTKPYIETQDTQKTSPNLITEEAQPAFDKENQQIWDAIDNNQLQLISEYISTNDVSLLEDYDGFTLLHRSVIAGNKDITELLLNKVEVSAKDNIGRTALHYACMRNDIEIIQILLEAFASPFDMDTFGKIPADYCTKTSDAQEIFAKFVKSPKKSLSLERESLNDSLHRAKRKKIKSHNENHKEIKRKRSAENGRMKVRRLTGPMEINKSVSYLQDFIVIKMLGVNRIGESYLVRDERDGSEYALKVIEKTKILEESIFKMVMLEKELLTEFDCPFIVPLKCSFQTKHKLILATHFCAGGILSEQLLDKGVFSLEEIRLYTSEIIEGLNYLHSKGYEHNALSLKTVLLTAQGHIMLTNFQLALKHSDSSESAENSFQDIDWHKLALLIYELATGISYPADQVEIRDPVLHDLFTLLLNSTRLDISLIKSHKFYEDIQWDHVSALKLRMPTPVGQDVYPQITNLSLSINDSFSNEAPIQNWSFISD